MKTFKEQFVEVRALLRYVQGIDNVILPLICIVSAIGAVLGYAGVILSSRIIDMLTVGHAVSDILLTALIGTLIIFALRAVQEILNRIRDIRHEKVRIIYDSRIGQKMMSMDFPQFEGPFSREMLEKIRNDNNWGAGISSVLWQFPEFMQSVFSVITAVILLLPLFRQPAFYQSPLSYALIGAMLALLILSTLFIERYVFKKEGEFIEASSRRGGSSWGLMWSGLSYQQGKDVRVYGADQLIHRKIIREWNTQVRKALYGISHVVGLGGAARGIFEGLGQGCAYLLIAALAASGGIGAGDAIRYAGSLFLLFNAMNWTKAMFGQIVMTADRQKSTLEFFDAPDVMHHGTLPVEKRSDYDFALEFHDVSFKYPGSETYALRHLNLRLHIGQRLAVVGMNGSGKTTMIKLLCRLYDPTEGRITLNGIDIRKYDYAEYAGIFGVVFQDFKIFSFPIGQNVAVGSPLNPDRARDCLEKAGLGERLRALPQGLDTPIYQDFDEDGIEISGGEAQKIALARALYKDAPFVILDEPTAALDPLAEYEIYSKFDSIVGEKTAVFISHRLSSCRFCQDIAVFDGGKLVQRGSHDELVGETGGKYYELWNAQARHYTSDSPESA